MTVAPSSPALAHSAALRAPADPNRIGPLARKWAVLHRAAGIVTLLAGLEAEPRHIEVRRFPAAIRDTGGWRRDLAEQGVSDLAAIMEPGLAALLSLHARGAPTQAPARALWGEFTRARAGLLALLPPTQAASAA
ncbi:hypothetical protein ACFO0A_02070 [Novosphingobium tardum]|jgi:hypothetical protein|uniref:Uncharacterized protein n=1 Tax=Novosphingobium tardum TaxID=1538021 RepID=A0ABV8RKA9_9SPHN